ncbi:hypothetical protein BGZ76_008113 [Entomortierella beljakovae]|nr:hypothetical protein BGZ76_008113 [Entomortierella beljakovae]
MMSKNHIAYHNHHFAAAAATIASPLPSPAISLNDTLNPWANIMTPSTSASTLAAPTGVLVKDFSTPSVVYSNNTQPAISFDGNSQPKNVINDVFLSSSMLYDDVELYLQDSASSNFDSETDSGFSTPAHHDEEDPSCFSTPMTPMSPFMESDTEDQLYATEECAEPMDLAEQELSKNKSTCDDSANLVVDMKRPMFIPVSICDARDIVAMSSLPTPPECNARKHSYDFLSNTNAFLLGGISATKRRRVLSVDMMTDAPASPPASNAGDDEIAELSDADSSACSFMARKRSFFQMRNVRHLTPTSPSMPEIVCFAPPTHDEYDYHPELDHSDDEEEEEESENSVDALQSSVAGAVPSDLFVVEADQEMGHNAYLSEDNYSSDDDEADFDYSSDNQMQIDAMSSSDDSDSDLSDVEDYPIRCRGTWHGPSLEEIASKKVRVRHPESKQPVVEQPKAELKQQQQPKTKPANVKVEVAAPAPVVASPIVPVTESVVTPVVAPKAVTETKSPRSLTLFQVLTKANIDWCRYCGTTEGVNWRPGPWGKRTLCNKHGCDFKGYGFACKLPRLDLTSYAHESVDQRIRPVLQHFCHGCQSQESTPGNLMVRCEGCPKAFHQKCHSETTPLSDEIAMSDKPWFCDETCKENVKKRRVCVELPKKRLPLMSTPKPASIASGSLAAAGSAAEMGRSRGMRAAGESASSRK